MRIRTNNIHKFHLPKIIKYLLSIMIWMIVWQITASRMNMELFLPTPLQVFKVLRTQLLVSEKFWLSIQFSMIHIGTGFLTGAATGIALAIASSILEPVDVLLWFPIRVIQTVPVASFVILMLLWIPVEELSVVIPFLMVLPILYNHTLTAIKETDYKLLEMAQLFHVPWYKKLRYIYIPEILPHVLSACSLAIGMAWKCGIAAEIIGLVRNSIGNQLYQSKIYLMTPELFAWTLVIIILSVACEQLLKLLTHLLIDNGKENSHDK